MAEIFYKGLVFMRTEELRSFRWINLQGKSARLPVCENKELDCHSHVICPGNPTPAILNSLAPALVTPIFFSFIAYFTKYTLF